jgi:hypothetical protein
LAPELAAPVLARPDTGSGRAGVIGAHSAKIRAALARPKQRRIWSEQNLARVMSKPIVKITRHSVPKGAKMFRVPAAEVLRCADILRWSEFVKK